MQVQDWISGETAVRLGLWIGRYMPRWVGYGLACLVADAFAVGRPKVYQKVLANQVHVLGPETPERERRRVARQIVEHAGRTYYDFFHAIGQPTDVLAQSVDISSHLFDQVQAWTSAGQGVLFLGVHMSNFDLGILALGARGLSGQILSLGEPNDGFSLLNDLRAMHGFEVTPVTPRSLRNAVRHLKKGGLVMTGVDRPVPGDGCEVEFFGHPSYLPTGPSQLAWMTGAKVLLGTCHHTPERGYVLEVKGPIELPHTGRRSEDILAGAQLLAQHVEEWVRAYPAQWMMFHPMWAGTATDS